MKFGVGVVALTEKYAVRSAPLLYFYRSELISRGEQVLLVRWSHGVLVFPALFAGS